ncbi:TRAP transporter small permease [Maritimibacter sp. DP1N21-5]|uniref:TRAP transporter small permease n=1 Tax=Maritimibacter sp. DP1N21-5 TaxID=2836867 RepID=UPI001C47CD71|nr:TRAP transporter small permease [Maritimibacter sp. DP1N21-5]MBV7410939.1 TRAP transporter small permease [Maritimibacter sp. DP1N21-5]
MLATVNKGADWLIRLSALLGTIGLLVAVTVILVDVVGRFFGSPLTGAQDMTQMAMVLIVFGGMALCDKIGGHVNVDLFEGMMPRWLIWAGDFASALIGMIIFAGIAWTTWTSVQLMRFQLGVIQKTNIIDLQFDWFKGFIIVASIITALGMFLRLITLVTTGDNGQASKGHS